MIIIDHEKIKSLGIKSECYEWVDYVLQHQNEYKLPTKTRIPLGGTDYFNVMPCVLNTENVMGVKVVTRNQNRRETNGLNIDSQILLYSLEDERLLALVDGNWITTMRTASIAVHTLIHCANKKNTIAFIGLGNIGTAIADILFSLLPKERVLIKIFNYKDHAQRFMERYSMYSNIEVQVCETYSDTIMESDVIISSVTYADHDFCSVNEYKKGCTVIPVHMRGFMECDRNFDHVIASDMESIKKFKYYDQFKKISWLNDVIYNPSLIRSEADDRVIIYNLGIALYDIYFAKQIYDRLTVKSNSEICLEPKERIYI